MPKFLLTFLLLIGLGQAGGCAQSRPFFDGAGEAGRPVMDAARARIEQIRKGDFSVRLVDEQGRPVAGKARVRLVRHAFDFGGCIWTLCERAAAGDPVAKKSLDAVDELFNTVTVCGYWKNIEPRRGELDWSRTDSAMAWARDREKNIRFHCVIYSFPKWLDQVRGEDEWWRVFEARILSVAERYGRFIKEYDVLNEMISQRVANFGEVTRQIDGFKDFPYLSEPANAARLLSIARKHLPDARLVVLETRLSTLQNPEWQAIVQFYRDLVKIGAPFDIAGYQGHFYAGGTMPMREGHPVAGPGAYTMKKLEEGLDELAALGKPMEVTEFSPPSRDGNRKDVARQDGLTQEELAAWTVNYYTLIFSKPYMRGLTRWNIADGGRGLDAGILDNKGNKKPAYEALRKLLKETWHTDWTGPVENGRIRFRGFYGTYEVQADGYTKGEFTCNSEQEREATALMIKFNGE